MGDGIRIKHQVVKGPAVLAIRDLTEPFNPPFSICNVCTVDPEHPVAHKYKTRHIDIDNEGWKDQIGQTIDAPTGTGIPITAITQADPAVVTAAGHGFSGM